MAALVAGVCRLTSSMNIRPQSSNNQAANQKRIPEFTLRVVKDGTAIHSEKAVVGSSATPTPVLSSELKTIEFHPYRVVPLSIIRVGSGVARSAFPILLR